MTDWPLNATVTHAFPTVGSNGQAVTATGFTAAGIKVYKGAGRTLRASTNGYTASGDIGSTVGVNEIAIDTSDNSDAGYYVANERYLVAGDITVEGEVTRVVFGFTLELAGGAIALTKALPDDIVEGTVTQRQVMRAVLASASGKLSGAETTEVRIRDSTDSKDRIVATVDANGNRTAVTLNLT